MSILSPPSTLDKLDPASQADFDALASMIGAPTISGNLLEPIDHEVLATPADYLSSDWLGAILADLDDGFALDD